MPSARRLLVAGLAVAAGHWALALVFLLLLHAPATAEILAASGVLLAGVSALGYRMIVRPRPGDGDGGTGVPDPGGEPPWWPTFEREFRDYAARRREPV